MEVSSLNLEKIFNLNLKLCVVKYQEVHSHLQLLKHTTAQ